MYIRKYTLLLVSLIVLGVIIFGLGYQYYYSMDNIVDMEEFKEHFRFTRVEHKSIQIYRSGQWEDFKIKGVELSSFNPGYGRYQTNIDQELVMEWLEEIGDLNANLIKIPGIQPPSFYNAIYDYNKNAESPIYTMHEVILDEKAILEYYDIFNKKVEGNFKDDIRKTINVVHGRAALFSKKRSHSGIYVKDISQYNLGYILGTNTNPEIISLTDLKHSTIDQYKGQYISLESGSAFEAFMAKMMDYANTYEAKKYEQISLFSYLTAVETDPLEYEQESNQTSNARINMDNISCHGWNNLFVAYKYHPNTVDFLDYEYIDQVLDEEAEYDSDYHRQISRLDDFYEKPVLISDTGISSSRGVSKVDLRDGFNRGGFCEKQQGEKLVELLESIDKTGLSGAVVGSWQDDWTRVTTLNNIVDYLDESASSYWQNHQASDEAFGLTAFEIDGSADYMDGDFREWESEDYIIDDKIKLKIKSDPSYLYLYLEKEDWKFDKEELYLGIDITPKSGSDYWKEEDASFHLPVDFIVHFNGYGDSKVVVHERYNIFDYLHKYYAPTIRKKDHAPTVDENQFAPVELLNRKRFYFANKDLIIPPIYYDTGKLKHGDTNPDSEHYNSLGDFYFNKDSLELKIPWDMLNVKNPMDMTIYDDFYLQGVEKSLEIKEIGFSLYDKSQDKTYKGEKSRKIEGRRKTREYKHRLKDSYYILQEYWGEAK